VVEHLPSKCETLSLNPSTVKVRRKKEEKKGRKEGGIEGEEE
jgi:hypothetical protein